MKFRQIPGFFIIFLTRKFRNCLFARWTSDIKLRLSWEWEVVDILNVQGSNYIKKKGLSKKITRKFIVYLITWL